MRRRSLLTALAGLASASLAGCSTGETQGGLGMVGEAPTARFELTARSDAELARGVLYGVDEADDDGALFERILDGGASVERTRPPLPEARHVHFDGGVYELAHEVVDRTPATTYSVKVDVPQGTAADARTVRFSALPEVDRETFAARGLDDGEAVGIGTTLLYTDAEAERSALVPDSEYSQIVWPDSRAEWVVGDAHETTLNAYEYTADRVASASEYGRRMRERFAFEFADLSDAEREIVGTAIEEDGYVVDADESIPSAFASLADRFGGRTQAVALDEDGEGDLSGPYVVRYDGEPYWTVLVVDPEALPETTAT
ncbi:hypothetical protein [Halosimplex salinum]|uniref:hypothetical protein n=1 Tax=Halosimplex salinum TaxID=1710538 RepID=UPI0013DDCB0F|nr:hypothetical protein [Halosimplex salinum]